MISTIALQQKTSFTILEIEFAINIWREEEKAELILGPNARKLADIYGLMIYNGWVSISVSDLSEIQLQAMMLTLNV